MMKAQTQVQSIYSEGYGVLRKPVMHDNRLTAEAKAIYAYLCCFAETDHTVSINRDKIIYDLRIGIERFYKHFKFLVKYEYVTVERGKGVKRRNIYTLLTEDGVCYE